MISALKSFWFRRSRRERLVIVAGAVFLTVVLGYNYAWLPVARERDRLLTSVPQLRAAAKAMERDARELHRLKGSARATPAELLSSINQTAIANGITPAPGEITAQDAGRIRVSIPSVPIVQALAWIGRLQSGHGIRLEKFRLQPAGSADVGKVEAVLVSRQ